ncbi:ribonuclease III [Henriciella aquimarina]|uniref:ribonuclease III n=1 Tax=Henriciella aquimarina TaxID=545261 RepID=UPI000A0237B3|nr:ribonuclease III [Henriciella aquimarina]
MKNARPKRTRLRAAGKAARRKRPELDAESQAELEGRLGYAFKNADWLNRALTHPSLIDNYDGDAQFSNQRLEFLGDRVLGLVMAEVLIARFPAEREGYLTKLFHQLVSGEACAEVGEGLGLRPFLFLDPSMEKNKRGSYDKSVADAVEALIAAIYRDGGLDAARDFITRHWIMELVHREVSQQNPKTRLSDWCGANRAPYAAYEIVDRAGPDHEPVFTVRARVDGWGEAVEKGRSRQEAEMAAADRLLRDLLRNGS